MLAVRTLCSFSQQLISTQSRSLDWRRLPLHSEIVKDVWPRTVGHILHPYQTPHKLRAEASPCGASSESPSQPQDHLWPDASASLTVVKTPIARPRLWAGKGGGGEWWYLANALAACLTVMPNDLWTFQGCQDVPATCTQLPVPARNLCPQLEVSLLVPSPNPRSLLHLQRPGANIKTWAMEGVPRKTKRPPMPCWSETCWTCWTTDRRPWSSYLTHIKGDQMIV